MARIDNIGNSPWFNFKLGKFELDNIISEKRILTLSNNGGFYQLYHFIPLGDDNVFGQMGDNQLGIELMGHSLNDRTRYSVALVSSNDGNVNLPPKTLTPPSSRPARRSMPDTRAESIASARTRLSEMVRPTI